MKLGPLGLVAVTLPAEQSPFHFFWYVSNSVEMPSLSCPFKWFSVPESDPLRKRC